MASLNQVTLELKVTGEAQATRSLNEFAKAGNKVGTSIAEVGRKVSSIEGELKSLVDLNRRKVITDRELAEAQEKHARALAALTGRTVDQSRAALEALANAKRKEEADRRAAQAAEQLARAQRNLEGSVLRQAQAVNQAVQRMDELSRLQAKGAVGSRNMAQAELEIARALARTNGYLKANGALNTQKALAELRAAQATRDAAAAQQGYNQLMASIDPVIAKQQRMAQAIQTVRAAHRAGIITAAEASAALRQYQAALESASLAGNRSALGMNRLGVMTQQAGYQFGDFAVQVQSGTNVMVALGQQATQLVGTLAMLSRSTRNIAIFSALGVAVPVTTAIAGGLMRAKVEADAVYEKFGFLEGVVRGLGTAFSQTGGVIVNILITIYQNLDVFITILGVAGVAAIVKFTAATATMGTILTATQLLFSGMAGAQLVAASATATLTAAMSRLMVVISAHPIIAAMTAALVVAVAVLYRARDASDGFKSNVEGLSEALKELRDNAKEAGIESARIALGADTGAQAIAMQRVLEIDKQIVAKQARIQDLDGHNLKNAERKLNALKLERDEILKLIEADRERVRVMQSAEAQSSLDAIISSYDKQYAIQVRIQNAQEQLNAAVNLGLISQERSVEIMKDYKDSLADVSDVAGDMADAQIQAYQEYQDLVNGVVKSQEDELALIEEITKYGKDSVEVARLRAEQEGIVKGLVGDALSQYVEMELRIREIEQGLEDASDAAYNIGGVSFTNIRDGATWAGALADNLNAARAKRLDELVGGNVDFFDPRNESGMAGVIPEDRGVPVQNRPGYVPPSTGSRGGAGVDPTEEFKRAKAAVDQLVASYDEQYAMSLKVGEATRKIEEAQRLRAIPANMDADQILRDYIASLEDAESPMLQLANTMSDALGDALMSVVDGTKSASDAFSDMARIIIKKAFEMAVINPILNSIFGTGGLNVSGYTNAPTLFANGAAFSGGSIIPFANGGVVGGPTTFPMANGNTGLMGEAGPEAIMPLKRGKDGKLGVTAEGGGNVVINQTFQFSANGDDSVKRIIAQEAPKIANLTQKQIMDQRRRGGAMKATFG